MSQPFTPDSAFLRTKCFRRQCLWRGSLNQESGWVKGQAFTTATNTSLLSTQPSIPSCDDCPFLHRTNHNQQFYLHWQLHLWIRCPQVLSKAFQRLLHIFSAAGQGGIKGSGTQVTCLIPKLDRNCSQESKFFFKLITYKIVSLGTNLNNDLKICLRRESKMVA